MKALILSVLFLGCTSPRVYQIGAERITCKDFFVNPCGVYLDRCDSGVSYYCQTNVSDVTDEVIILEERVIEPSGRI
jgi:hypothetical protein